MRIRVLRILEYVGDAEWVFKTMEANKIKGEYRAGTNIIREAQLGTIPEIFTAASETSETVIGE